MYPGMLFWWQQSRRHIAAKQQDHAAAGGGPSSAWRGIEASSESCGEGSGGHFGVRRPLRFLAYKLQLDDRQVAEIRVSWMSLDRARPSRRGRQTFACSLR